MRVARHTAGSLAGLRSFEGPRVGCIGLAVVHIDSVAGGIDPGEGTGPEEGTGLEQGTGLEEGIGLEEDTDQAEVDHNLAVDTGPGEDIDRVEAGHMRSVVGVAVDRTYLEVVVAVDHMH